MPVQSRTITYRSIGTIHSPLKGTVGAPIQPAAAKGIRGTVEIRNEFTAALRDLEGFSHVILIYHFHLANGFSLKVIPFLDEVPRGVFATRAPARPNPVGISIVKLLKVRKNELFVENLDIVDGTPLLDIKPYVEEFDRISKSKIGWLAKSAYKSKTARSDARFGKSNELE